MSSFGNIITSLSRKNRLKDISEAEGSCSTNKKYEETSTKGSSTLAQKRLDKIRQEAKAKIQFEQQQKLLGIKSLGFNKKGLSPTKQGLSTSIHKKQGLSSAKKHESPKGGTTNVQNKKQELSASKTRTKFDDARTSVQSRLEKYKPDKNKTDSPTRGTKFIDGRTSVQSRLEKYKRGKNKTDSPSKDNKFRSIKLTNIKKQSNAAVTIERQKNKSPDAQDKVNNNLGRNLFKRSPTTNIEIDIPELKNKRKKGCEQPENVIFRKNTNTKIVNKKFRLNDSYLNSKTEVAVKGKEVLTKPENSLNLSKDGIEDMEWEVSCDDVAFHLQTVRSAVENVRVEMMDWQDSALQINTPPDNNVIHYVIDTNVFISSLRVIKKLKEESSTDDMENIIVIPWQVLKELDWLKMKQGSLIASAARKAINYLLKCTTNSQSSNVVWQTQQQAAEHCQSFYVEIPDDHLVKCCIQLNLSGHNVVLVSNDNNLRLKSSVYNIITISDDKLLEKFARHTNRLTGKLPLEETPTGSIERDIYTFRLTNIFNRFLNKVIQLYFRSTYGSMWLWHLPEKPPLTLKILLELLENYATKIFKTKDYKDYLDAVASFFRLKTYCKLSTSEVDIIARKCLKLAKSFSSEECYVLEVMQFENDLAFLKSRDPPTYTPFSDLCCKLTIKRFQIFEATIIGYCYTLAQVLGINISDPILCDRASVLPESFDIKLVSVYLKIIRRMNVNLESLGKIPPGKIKAHIPEIMAVYNTLVKYTEDSEPFFTAEDVVDFFKNDIIRNSLPVACSVFNSIIIFLETARRIAPSKKI